MVPFYTIVDFYFFYNVSVDMPISDLFADIWYKRCSVVAI